MDRKLARKNLFTGFVVAAVAAVMFGLTFLVASAYLELAVMTTARSPTARASRSISRDRALVPFSTAVGITLALVGLILSWLFVAARRG